MSRTMILKLILVNNCFLFQFQKSNPARQYRSFPFPIFKSVVKIKGAAFFPPVLSIFSVPTVFAWTLHRHGERRLHRQPPRLRLWLDRPVGICGHRVLLRFGCSRWGLQGSRCQRLRRNQGVSFVCIPSLSPFLLQCQLCRKGKNPWQR